MEIKQIIADLEAQGLTQAQIAERTPCAQSTVSGIKTGARGVRPSHDLVNRLTALHSIVLADEQAKGEASATA